MKRFVTILLVVFALADCCSQQPAVSQLFFSEPAGFQCFSEDSGQVSLRPRFRTYDAENFRSNFSVPDSIEFFEFYNAFGERILHAYYSLVKPETIDSLLQSISGKAESATDKVFAYVVGRDDLTKVVQTCFINYYEEMDKDLKITSDSLMKIAVEFYSIDSVDTMANAVYSHFCSGNDPFSFKKSRHLNLIISGFCFEALSNRALVYKWSAILKKYREDLADGTLKGNPDRIKNELDKNLKERLLNDDPLRESIMNYYYSRKNIEPFEVIE